MLIAGIGENPMILSSPYFYYRVRVRRGHDLRDLRPRGAYEPAFAPRRLVASRLLRVLDDGGPGVHGIPSLRECLAVHLHEDTADVGVLYADRGVGVPSPTALPRS